MAMILKCKMCGGDIDVKSDIYHDIGEVVTESKGVRPVMCIKNE